MACGKKAKDIHDFGDTTDVTESVYHRLKAGMFDPATDPIVYKTIKLLHFRDIRQLSGELPLGFKEVPHEVVRISWDRGAFRVQSDDKGRVVIYMDAETLLSHVQISTLKEFNNMIEFREFLSKPFR
ncbi:MAG: hypothetical protein V6Z82_04330 [Flavobacteriales bacterium]